MDTDFLIVGGGIGGAVLARLLARGGKRVTVLERDLAPPPLVRPEVLWPATLKTLSALVPREQFRAALLRIGGIEFRSGQRTLASFHVPNSTGGNPAAGTCITDPNQTRALLLAGDEFDLRRGVRVTGLLREGGRVLGVKAHDAARGIEYDIAARCTIADDGARSLVRQECGLGIELQPLAMDLLCFGFDWPAKLPRSMGRIWINEHHGMSSIFLLATGPLPTGRGAALVPVRPALLENPEQITADWQSFLRTNPDAASLCADRRCPGDMVRVRIAYGHAPRYGSPGVFLIGDAAHPVTPAGGQGANLAIADAAALATLLLRDPENALSDYEALRRPAAQRSLRFSRGAARALRLPDAALRGLFRTALRIAGLRPDWFAPLVRLPATSFQTKDRPRARWCLACP